MPRSPRFLANRDEVVLLDAVARRYGVRPSTLLRGAWLDYQVDIAVMHGATTNAPGVSRQPPTHQNAAALDLLRSQFPGLVRQPQAA